MKAIVGRRSERVEQQHIVQLARTLGASVYVLGTVRRRGDYAGTMMSVGLPDLWMMWGRVGDVPPKGWTVLASSMSRAEPCGLWWEVKRARGRRTPAQMRFADECERAGVPYGWGTYDEFVEWCRAHGRLRGEVGRTA